jgi:ferredoxin--NADP+ reductase
VYKVIDKQKLASTVTLLKLQAPEIAQKVKPGQFVILRLNEEGERIPLTVNDFDRERGTITIVFQEVGKTTKLMGRLNVNESMADVVGPLGRHTEIEKFGKVICIGGGVGTAVIYPITRALYQAGNDVIGIVGARTKDLLTFVKEMEAVTQRLIVTTDDGSMGRHGLVTDPLKEMLQGGETIDRVIAIGPAVMMKFVCRTTEPYKVKTIVSLNPIMLDATGMCGVCRVQVGGETKFGCVDGPEFDGHKVDFDLLINRLQQYLAEEKISLSAIEG